MVAGRGSQPARSSGRRIEAGINFFDTANVYSRRHQRGDHRPGAEGLRQARRDRARHQGARRDARGAERPRAVAQGDHDRDRRTACAGWAPTTSTSTRSTAGTAGRRSRRRSRRCTTWSRPARPATSAPRRCTPGSSPRRQHVAERQRLDAVRHACRTTTTCSTARRSARCCRSARDQGIGVIPWSPLARGRLTRDWDDHHRAQRDRRVRPDPVPARGPAGPSSGRGGRQRPRDPPGAGRAGLAAGPPRRDRADRRGHQGIAPGRRGRRARRRADQAGDGAAGEAVRPAPHRGPYLSGRTDVAGRCPGSPPSGGVALRPCHQ